MEYMQRQHTVAGHSRNELVYVRLPPPLGRLHWSARTTAVGCTVTEPEAPEPQNPEQYLSHALSVLRNSSMLCTIA